MIVEVNQWDVLIAGFRAAEYADWDQQDDAQVCNECGQSPGEGHMSACIIGEASDIIGEVEKLRKRQNQDESDWNREREKAAKESG